MTAKCDADAVRRFVRKSLKEARLSSPRPIGTDEAGRVPGAIRFGVADRRPSPDPVHHVTKHFRQGKGSDLFRVEKAMPRIGSLRSFNTARRTIKRFEAMLWHKKGLGFASEWTVDGQNDLAVADLRA
ncbi:DDE-type integrase/transposase/recombinase [Fulvimarina sp. 2208YS6-2-32]|uniref:DDE-type integrase/transposase/recombinase n=1 Tax=Fulvimarina uroteuthidis TaxID=3098149 RepID=A0ABU5I4A0_9HYPH|nr:DDE-type integrase/transposase/recombinase [Fulvimarina sp. 2208YS6-2-32]